MTLVIRFLRRIGCAVTVDLIRALAVVKFYVCFAEQRDRVGVGQILDNLVSVVQGRTDRAGRHLKDLNHLL